MSKSHLICPSWDSTYEYESTGAASWSEAVLIMKHKWRFVTPGASRELEALHSDNLSGNSTSN